MNPRFILALAISSLLTASARAEETAESLLAQSRAVLAQVSGEIALPGLREPVEVSRDRWGVPHIYAQNQDDLFFAQGVVAAQDRLFQMDMWRRVGIGETAEVLGPSALEGDRFARLVKYRGDMAAEWASYSPDTQRIAEAFTRGINAHIDSLGDRLPIEYQLLKFRPKHWQPEDILGRMSGIIMVRNFRSEIDRARLVAAVGAEQARRLAPTDPVRAYGPVPGFDLSMIDVKALAGYEAATKAFDFSKYPAGSNNWVVDGTLSASGKPMLANDPHRSITLPSLRYVVHLNAPGWNVMGGGEPGLPGVAIGHNDRIAWGMTIVGTDQSDFYIEETNPDDPTQYRVGNAWQKMDVVRETVAVRGQAASSVLELKFTRHGPVIHEDAERHRAYALRWAGSEPGTAGYLGSLALDRANNWPEFLAGVKGWKLPTENLVYADVDGNIGWVAAALTPVRKGWDGLLPVPGARGEYEWQRILDVVELPQVYNPKSHYVATANHNILPPGYNREIAYEWATGHRYQMAKRRLEAQSKFTLDDFKDIQHDNTSLPALALARLLKSVELGDPKLESYKKVLVEWDGVLSTDCAAGPLVETWMPELLKEFFGPRVPKDLVKFVSGNEGIVVMLKVLENPDETWFGPDYQAARDKLLITTFAASVRKVSEKLSADVKNWAWGKLHVTPFHHPLSTLGPVYAAVFDRGPLAHPGDSYTLNAARHNEKFEHTHGASFRHVLDLADWDKGMATNTPGQSAQPGSPHYDDLLPLWDRGEFFPLAFSRAKVEEVTTNRLRLVPK
jgi:penicillin amidase